MKILLRIIVEIIFIILYFVLIKYIVDLTEEYLPRIMYGTWKSYLVIGFALDLLIPVFQLFTVILYFIFKFIKRSKFTNVLCTIFSVIGFIVSIDFLWSYTSALFYASFWEYFWCTHLSLLILIVHIQIVIILFYTTITKKA